MLLSFRWTLSAVLLLLILLLRNTVSKSEQQRNFLERNERLRGLRRNLSGPSSCEPLTVNFDKAANGTTLEAGTCVENEWLSYGMTLFAEGGEGNLPCLLDTANPGSEKNGGDPDLGAPNRECTPSGPGKGVGGEPGSPGENCDPLGNVLIIQEPGVDVPDDNRKGGIINLDFPFKGGQYVYEIGLLDIDYDTSVKVIYEEDDVTVEEDLAAVGEYTIDVPLLGDNSKQVVPINQDRVRWIKVMLARSGAVTHVKFCPPEETTTPVPIAVAPPTGTPPTSAPTSCPGVDEPCMDDENFQVCTELIENGCMDLLVLESCPLQFRCGDATPVPSMNVSPRSDPPTAAPITVTSKPTKKPTRTSVLALPTKASKSPTAMPIGLPPREPVTGYPTKPMTAPPTVLSPREPVVGYPTKPMSVPPSVLPPRDPVYGVPTKSPVFGPTIVDVVVDFEFAADGTTIISPGTYVESDWKEFGLTLSATGGFGTLPRIFNTANPGTVKEGDPDLGSPNNRCSPPGPGVGEGGEPDTKGANCVPLGNVIIVQEVNDDMSVPDDSADGGTIVFDFEPVANKVYEIGLLDIDYETSITVMYESLSDNISTKTIQVPLLGDNSFQVVEVGIDNVKQLVVTMKRSGAVAFISFAYEKVPLSSTVVSAETPLANEILLSMSMSMS